jgi:uroporphyrinogen decarboxylase
VQVSAKGMDDLAGLKSAGGGQLTFWGGIDTQQLLPNGSPDEIRREVRRTIEILGKDGGYVLASVHNLLNNVPAENIIAMYETALGRSILRTAS